MYASIGEVRAAGVAASVSDATITAVLAGAKERIDRYCGDTFETTGTITVRGALQGGVVLLPYRAQSVTSVVYADVAGATPWPVTSYTVSSSATVGDVDAVRQIGYGLLSGALLDVAWEPVRSTAVEDRPVLVTGVFGWTTTPDAVNDAATLLAVQDAQIETGAAAVNLEGDADLGAPSVVPLAPRRGERIDRRTTGSALADALLAPYVRRRLRVS
jgi:hypothetical protein